jgi:hypothetical protein
MTWIPLRTVQRELRCAFCRGRIPKGRPGTRTGERGTKAWLEKETGRIECLGCRTEGFRAEEARAEIDRAKGIR